VCGKVKEGKAYSSDEVGIVYEGMLEKKGRNRGN